MPHSFRSHSYESIPLEDIPEDGPFTPFTQYETARAEHGLLPVIRRSLIAWRCFHIRRHVRLWSTRALFYRGVLLPFLAIVFILGLLKFISLAWQGLVYLFPDDLDSSLDGWTFPGGRPSIFAHWTTHGVIPVACHSHNDYLRDAPLNSALAAGCISVEADIWLSSSNDLLVGHTPHTLSHSQTLESLYLHPLLEMLQRHNTRSADLSGDTDIGKENVAGVFTNDPMQSLVLLVDFKADGERLWPFLVEQLEPLRSAGYLTHVNGSTVVHRPVTIVVSGKAPFNRVLEQTTGRDIFYDAPLGELSLEGESAYNPQNSYYASTDFRRSIGSLAKNRFSQDQLAEIRRHVKQAHEQGLKVRYWGTPTWPRGLRNHVWHVLVREGVDLINVDDLRDATRQDWRKHRSWWT